jgi:O-antigen/teichoic acid export membrane protein
VSVLRKAARSGIWFAAFKFITQMISWMGTIVVARILSPEDYGLMSLASILTGYVQIFSELGLGSAIVQREEITQQEYSSNFWFSLLIGLGFASIAFGLSFPTGWIFNEPRLIPITQLISVLFIIGALMIVPFNILMRELKFKAIGMIQLLSVVVSIGSMLWMAYEGFGVWTLIGGTLILRVMTVILVFFVTKWRPNFHFKWSEVRPFLKFGIDVAGGRSLFYIFQKSDIFIIGKLLGTQSLGYYSFAMQLASLPTDKIVSTVNQVLFPVFSRLQHDLSKIQEMYLRTTKYMSIFVSPLFFGGAIWGDEIIHVVLGEKWVPVIFLFKCLCLSQLFVSMIAINGFVHTSMGRPRWSLYFYLASIILMPAPFYFSAQYGLNALSFPWLTVYPLLCISYIWITLKKLKISLSRYMKNFIIQTSVVLFIITSSKVIVLFLNKIFFKGVDYKVIFPLEVVIGLIFYLTYLLYFERKTLLEIWNIRKA